VTLWRDKPVRVEAHQVPRYFWTTVSIDVFLDDRCILRTGGQVKNIGWGSAAFSEGGSLHQVEVSWGRSRMFRFPYQLRIDGVALQTSHVRVENWYMILIPACIIGFFTAGLLFCVSRLLSALPVTLRR